MKESSQLQEGYTETKESEPLTPDKATKLLFLSFRFSQGDAQLQQMLFFWLHSMHPDWRIDAGLLGAAGEKSVSLFEKFFQFGGDNASQLSKNLYHQGVYKNEIKENVQDFLSILKEILNGEKKDMFTAGGEVKTLQDINLVEEIAYFIAARDEKYIAKGRPRTGGESGHKTAIQDPFLSHIRYYALEGHSTGSEEFDALFAEIKKFVLEKIAQGEGGIFSEVLDYYK